MRGSNLARCRRYSWATSFAARSDFKPLCNSRVKNRIASFLTEIGRERRRPCAACHAHLPLRSLPSTGPWVIPWVDTPRRGNELALTWTSSPIESARFQSAALPTSYLTGAERKVPTCFWPPPLSQTYRATTAGTPCRRRIARSRLRCDAQESNVTRTNVVSPRLPL